MAQKIEYVVVIKSTIDSPSLWTYFEKEEQGPGALKSAIHSNAKDINTYMSHLVNYPARSDYWQSCLDRCNSRTFEVMTYEDYLLYEESYWLDQPYHEVSEEDFNDALNVLPPIKWCHRDGFELFCMSEFTTGPYTLQYAHKDNKYYVKTVNAFKESSWIYNFIKEVA